MIAAAATWRIDATAARRAAVAHGRALNRRLAAAAGDDTSVRLAATLPGPAARPFRFGMLCRHAGGDGTAWRERVGQAEDLGFDTLLVSDHLDDQSAPIPALGAAAMVSSVLRLGTLVLSNPFRPAAVVAKDAETLQRLSDGRFELGLGTGWSDHDLSQLDGRPVRRDRVADLARTIERIRPTLAGGGGLRPIPLHVGGGAGCSRWPLGKPTSSASTCACPAGGSTAIPWPA
jgi:alkanesulfonate monooxygenase SsuD/methylene tetrahydromethanopterin reductase-like flavin-dependent oxidoreductase (luciferase family)